jgi:ERCC4-type nuclease
VGSAELAPLLRALHIKTELVQLDSADVSFSGNGPQGRVEIGVERKSLRDALKSMEDGRFAGVDGQLQRMLAAYDFQLLVVEGKWKANHEGILMEALGGGWRPVALGRRSFMHRELENWLTSLTFRTSLHLRTTYDLGETARAIANLYNWFAKGWDEHKSLNVFYRTPPPVAMFHKPSPVRVMAKEIPGIGWDRSLAVEAAFATVVEMILATPEEWEKIPGVGKVLSRRVPRWLAGEWSPGQPD